MHLPDFFHIRTEVANRQNQLLPFKIGSKDGPVSCSNCSFVNHINYNFCTNCGFPVHPDPARLYLYTERLEQRKNLLRKCAVKVEHARNALYVLAAGSMLGIFYIFSDARQKVITGLLMVFLGMMYAGLGWWSLQKPFTAMLVSLLTMLTFTAINTWAEFSSMTATAGSVYLLFLQIILIYFLLQGVKGAFRADVLEEEFKM